MPPPSPEGELYNEFNLPPTPERELYNEFNRPPTPEGELYDPHLENVIEFG